MRKTVVLVLLLAGVHVAAQDAQTLRFYANLKKLSKKGFMFGHQDDLAYGVNWKYEPGRSDVKEVVGDYPAVYGWELGGLETGNPKNLDGVPFDKMRQFIKEGYERGGVITISWHARSPLDAPKGAWDTTHGTVAAILPGGSHHQLYTSWLDKLADFFLSLKGIPVLFRPYHELTGNWFWWGKNTCTAEEFKTLWRFTVNYLRKAPNLLYVYNTSGNFSTREEYLERYPGDDVVEMISFDAYQYNGLNIGKQLEIVSKIAGEKDKLFALAETGYEAIPDAHWWTGTLLKAIGEYNLSYVLVWRNYGVNNHFYAPHKGHGSAKDFVKFYGEERTLFEKDVAKEKLYQ